MYLWKCSKIFFSDILKLLNNLQFRSESHNFKTLRCLAISSSIYNASTSGDGGDSGIKNRSSDGKKTSKGGDGNGRDGQLRCPKCGTLCSHVETFVSKFSYESLLLVQITNFS